MIVISSDLVLSTPVGVDLNAPVIGWRNLLTGVNVAADYADVDFPVSNVANPSTYLQWRSTTAVGQHVTVTFGEVTDVDYLAVAGHNFGTAGIAASFQGAEVTDGNQKVLLHLEGADASTSFPDSNVGGSAHTWTAAGNAQVDTAQFKFGSSSLFCDGTGDWIATPDHADFALGSGDFTVDAWFYVNAAGGATNHLCGQTDAGNTAAGSSFRIYRKSTNVIEGLVSDGSSSITVTGTTQFTDVVNPGWHHVALVRSGDVLSLYVDGVLEDSDALVGSVPNSSEDLLVGNRNAAAGTPWSGWIDEFRVVVGRAEWTANFAPEGAPYDQWLWEQLADEQIPADDQPIIWRSAVTTVQAARLRMAAGTEAPRAAVIYVGELLEFQRRIYVGHSVLQYNRRANVVTGFSDEATFLGRLVLGELNESSLNLQNITPAFFRTEMDPWLQNSVSAPFFFAWRPTSYPLEVGFCWMSNDPQMSNQRANGMVQVSASLRGVPR